jgi:AAHS family 4-hydroxybenzoate transporter-like MFS transporter
MLEPNQSVIDVSQLVETRPVGAGQWLLIALCMFVVTLDGFNTQIMGYVVPSLIGGWHISPARLGPVISSGLVGLMLGALILGTLGDRIGRKSILLLSTLLFGVFALATGFVTSPSQMLVLRFLTGVGLGGAVPAAIALISEFSPNRARAGTVTLTVSGFAIGPAIGGLVAGGLIHGFGWRSMFVLGGVIPLAMLPVLWLLLPESLRFVSRHDAQSDQIARNLNRVFPGLNASAQMRYVYAENAVKKAPVRDIFTGGRAPVTLLLWAAIFLNLVGLNLLTSWLTTILSGLGFPISNAVHILAMFQVGGVIGTLALAHLANRFDFVLATSGTFLFAGVMVILIGVSGGSIQTLHLVIFAAGLFIVGGQCSVNTLSGILYPSYIRSTASGWALSMGRLGAVFGPLIGSNLLALNFDLTKLFYVISVPFFLAAAAIMVIRVIRGSGLADSEADGSLFSQNVQLPKT